ncbi:MAG: DMT family transporter [Candidatus Riflebacteria bacterium]|nr:DMT family transporter [Candidatus Riflebacteria bacterium]
MGEFLLVLCGVLRSTDLFFRLSVMKIVPVLTMITWEHFINACIVIPILWKLRDDFKKISLRDGVFFLLVGCGSSVGGLLCFSKAYSFMNPALVVLLQKLQPLITILFSALLLGETLNWSFYPWAAIAVASSYFVSFSFTNPFSGEWHQIAWGTLFSLLAAFFWGGGTAWGKILLKSFNPLFVFANRLVIGAIFAGALMVLTKENIMFERVFASEDPLFLKLFYMALVPGLFATTFFYQGLQKVRASISAILELSFPLSSIIIMWAFFNKSLDSIQICSGIILCISMFMVVQSKKSSS